MPPSRLDDIMADLISKGYTSGSLADRELARLVATSTNPRKQFMSINDLYTDLNLPKRLFSKAGVPIVTPPVEPAIGLSGVVERWRADSITGRTDGQSIINAWDPIVGSTSFGPGANAQAPTYLASGAGGKPAVKFLGSSQQFMQAGGASIPQPATVFVVCKLTIAYSNIFFFNAEAIVVAADKVESYAGTSLPSGANAITENVPVVLEFLYNGSSSAIISNGNVSSTGNAGTAGVSPTKYLGRHLNQGRWLTGEISEVIICDRPQGSTERSAFKSYTQFRYGVG